MIFKPTALFAMISLPIFAQIPPEMGVHAKKAQEGMSDLMVIPPNFRTKDLKGVYDYYTKNKIPGEIYYTLTNGEKLRGVEDVATLAGETVLVFKLNTTQGLRYRVVFVEDIQAVGFQ